MRLDGVRISYNVGVPAVSDDTGNSVRKDRVREREREEPSRRATAGDDAVIALSATASRPWDDMHNIAPGRLCASPDYHLHSLDSPVR